MVCQWAAPTANWWAGQTARQWAVWSGDLKAERKESTKVGGSVAHWGETWADRVAGLTGGQWAVPMAALKAFLRADRKVAPWETRSVDCLDILTAEPKGLQLADQTAQQTVV